MAFNLQSDGDDDAGLHEINVTPFIDVMLVLLIVFMVAAPLATVNVPLDLPVSSAKATPEPLPPVTVSLQTDLSVHLGEEAIARAMLPSRLSALVDGDRLFPHQAIRPAIRTRRRSPHSVNLGWSLCTHGIAAKSFLR